MKAIELGGRKLRVLAQANIAHDFWLTRQIREAGIHKLELGAHQTAAQFADDVINRVMESGAALVLLGGLLAPADLAVKDWTPAIAADMTAFIETLTTDEDKIVVRGLVADAILAFFRTGLVSFSTSQTSSMTSREPEAIARPSALSASSGAI